MKGQRWKTILIVEDELPIVEVVRFTMTKKKMDTVTAKGVAQAIEYIHQIPEIDAVWLDHYLLGKEGGLDFMRHLHDHDASRKLPVFVVTKSSSPEKQKAYADLGAVAFYVKIEHHLADIVQGIKSYLEKDE